MGWKYSNYPFSSTLFLLFLAIALSILFPKTTITGLLILGILVLLEKFSKSLDKQNEPTLLNKQDRIETERKSKERYEEFKNYKGSESYQALLKKYDGNIPGSGQGDRGGEKIGKKGGRYIKRVSKKTGKPYRHYF